MVHHRFRFLRERNRPHRKLADARPRCHSSRLKEVKPLSGRRVAAGLPLRGSSRLRKYVGRGRLGTTPLLQSDVVAATLFPPSRRPRPPASRGVRVLCGNGATKNTKRGRGSGRTGRSKKQGVRNQKGAVLDSMVVLNITPTDHTVKNQQAA